MQTDDYLKILVEDIRSATIATIAGIFVMDQSISVAPMPPI